LIDSLESLKDFVNRPHLPDEMAAFGVTGARKGALASLFATHPDLDDRIRALEGSSYPEHGT
jgi:heat shock protein HtpX